MGQFLACPELAEGWYNADARVLRELEAGRLGCNSVLLGAVVTASCGWMLPQGLRSGAGCRPALGWYNAGMAPGEMPDLIPCPYCGQLAGHAEDCPMAISDRERAAAIVKGIEAARRREPLYTTSDTRTYLIDA